MTIRNRKWMAAVALAAFAIAPVAAVATANDPAGALSSYNDGVVAVMKADLAVPARVTRFEKLVKAHYDMPAIAALVVGPKWTDASPADRNSAIAALTHHSAVQLARNFTNFSGEKFITDPDVVSRGNNKVVKVTIASNGSNNILQYRLRQSGGDWRIIDVVSEGVSELALQRAELASTIASDGIAGMAKKLTTKDAEMLKK